MVQAQVVAAKTQPGNRPAVPSVVLSPSRPLIMPIRRVTKAGEIVHQARCRLDVLRSDLIHVGLEKTVDQHDGNACFERAASAARRLRGWRQDNRFYPPAEQVGHDPQFLAELIVRIGEQQRITGLDAARSIPATTLPK